MEHQEFNEKFSKLYNQFVKNEQFFFNALKPYQFRAIDAVANRMGSLSGTPSYNAIIAEANGSTCKNITEPHARQWLDELIALVSKA